MWKGTKIAGVIQPYSHHFILKLWPNVNWSTVHLSSFTKVQAEACTSNEPVLNNGIVFKWLHFQASVFNTDVKQSWLCKESSAIREQMHSDAGFISKVKHCVTRFRLLVGCFYFYFCLAQNVITCAEYSIGVCLQQMHHTFHVILAKTLYLCGLYVIYTVLKFAFSVNPA